MSGKKIVLNGDTLVEIASAIVDLTKGDIWLSPHDLRCILINQSKEPWMKNVESRIRSHCDCLYNETVPLSEILLREREMRALDHLDRIMADEPKKKRGEFRGGNKAK